MYNTSDRGSLPWEVLNDEVIVLPTHIGMKPVVDRKSSKPDVTYTLLVVNAYTYIAHISFKQYIQLVRIVIFFRLRTSTFVFAARLFFPSDSLLLPAGLAWR